MTQHSKRNPDAGDLSTVAALNHAWRLAAELTAETHATMGRCAGDLDSAVWNGDAAEAWHGAADVTRTRCDQVVSRLQAASEAAVHWVDQVNELASQAEPLRAELTEAETTLDLLWRSTIYTGEFACFDPSTREIVRDRLQTDAEEQQARAWQMLGDLEEQRRAVDAAFLKVLDEDASESWSRTYIALKRAGITDTAELTTAGAPALAALMQRVSGVDGTAQDRADLAALLEMWGTDQKTLDSAFTALGGTGTAALLTALMRDPDIKDARSLATAIRAGLSRASRDWSSATATRFATDLIGPLRRHSGRPLVIGFLFGDSRHAPMGRELTIAVANQIDRIERTEPQGAWTEDSLGDRNLWAVHLGERDVARLRDPGARVLQTLGEYPNDALAWLTDSGLDDPRTTDRSSTGETRMQYWFGERDSSANTTGDGFEGVSALWAGAQRAEGSILDPDDANRDVEKMVANVSSQVFARLSANPALTHAGVGELGSVALATAVGQQIPQLTEYPVVLEGSTPPGAISGRYNSADVPGIGLVTFVDAEHDWVADVVGVASSEAGGREVLTAAVVSHEQTLRNAALDPSSSLTAVGAIERIAHLESALLGAHTGADLTVAEDRDAAVEEAVDAGVTIVGFVPGPSALLGKSASLTLQNATSGLWAATVSQAGADVAGLSHYYADAVATELAAEPAREAALRDSIGSLKDMYVSQGMLDPDEWDQSTEDKIVRDALSRFGDWAREAERRG